jgi:hypothetical protein
MEGINRTPPVARAEVFTNSRRGIALDLSFEEVDMMDVF